MAKNDKKIYEGYKKHQKLWNGIIIVFLFIVAVAVAVLTGQLKLEAQPVVLGEHPLTWFHWVMLVILVVLLGFGVVALKRDSSEKQQEIYRQEREEAIRLRQEVMEERRQELQNSYEAMKRRRTERLAARQAAEQEKAPQSGDGAEPAPSAEPAGPQQQD